jgi:hypothetical protein
MFTLGFEKTASTAWQHGMAMKDMDDIDHYEAVMDLEEKHKRTMHNKDVHKLSGAKSRKEFEKLFLQHSKPRGV